LQPARNFHGRIWIIDAESKEPTLLARGQPVPLQLGNTDHFVGVFDGQLLYRRSNDHNAPLAWFPLDGSQPRADFPVAGGNIGAAPLKLPRNERFSSATLSTDRLAASRVFPA
jgi:hypothetical protein